MHPLRSLAIDRFHAATLRVHAWLLILIASVSAGLRVAMLDKPIDYDEAYTYLFYVSTPFADAISSFGPGANNHLFHTVCAWLSTHALGASAVTLRLPVWLAGIALPLLTYRLGALVADRHAALSAAALTGGSHHLVQYSVNARGYGLQASLFLAALIATWRLVETPRLTRVLPVALFLALALYTVPTLILSAGSLFVWGAWRALRHETRRGLRLGLLLAAGVSAALLTLLCYAPVLPAMMRLKFRFTGSPPYGALSSFAAGLVDYLFAGMPSAIAWLVSAGIAMGLVLDIAQRRMPLALCWLGPPLACVLLHRVVSDSAPFPRNFVFLLPLLFILASRTASVLLQATHAHAQLSLIIASALFVGTAFDSHARYRAVIDDGYANAQRIFREVVLPMQPGDYLLVDGNVWDRLRFYAVTQNIQVQAVGRRQWDLTVVRRGERQTLRRGAGRVFVLDAKPKSRKLVNAWLDRHFAGAAYTREPRLTLPSRTTGSVTWFEVNKVPN